MATTEERIERLKDQLEAPDLSDKEIEKIERKIGILKALEE